MRWKPTPVFPSHKTISHYSRLQGTPPLPADDTQPTVSARHRAFVETGAVRIRFSTMLRRSEFKGDADAFLWCTGIEDTFIAAPWPSTGRTLDEYELTRHYDLWREDLGLMAELGVNSARYGIPWHRVNPQKGVWNWEWPDKTLNRLLELGIEPIVDLVHYGVPSWI